MYKRHNINKKAYIIIRGIDMGKFKKILFFLFVLAIFMVPGFIFSKNTEFYKEINKPVFAPPGIVFSIVWAGLYTLQAYYITKVYFEYNDKEGKKLLIILSINALANILYTPVFFVLKSTFGGFIISLITLVTVVLIVYKSKIIDIKEWYLEIPYLLWSIFALILSISIYLMN